MAQRKGTAKKSAKRLARLKGPGAPLKGGGRTKPLVSAKARQSAMDAAQVAERLRREKEAGVKRGSKR
jgi:hypothetical protein